MKKLFASILACTMIAGAMSVAAFAADPAAGKGSMTVTTSATAPEMPDPSNPAEPFPTDDNGTSLKAYINTDITFATTEYAAAINNPGIPLADGSQKLGIVAKDLTGKAPSEWGLSIAMGDFELADGRQAIPGFTLHLFNPQVIGAAKADTATYGPMASATELTAGEEVAVFASNATNGSTGYWAGVWDAKLQTSGTVLVGAATATMNWKYSVGL